ncbi:transmembrane and coiled-coil domain-containing protein 6 isoform X4 [Alligator sinensis]|uniref:Transmembrane and coiled-coil domain-containing protein 6 isoform X4 n=1 Tax=Alligator sinensis TaxID=38654 RepID=A0A3Q0HJQ4_ALLSI|nr:transmembrane and coiled-coil domain-containing protein 6 isoform X4 [Alligator sinensis]
MVCCLQSVIVLFVALRKARKQQQLISKRLLREDTQNGEGKAGMEIPTDPLSEQEVLQLLRDTQKGTEERKKSLSCLRQALQHKETQQKFVRLEGSMRVLIGLFTSSLADVQMEAAHCLHELSHSSDPAVAEACLPATSYLLTYLSGHSIEFTSPHEAVLEGLGYVLSQLLQAKEASIEIIPCVNNALLISQGIMSTLVLLLLELASMVSKAVADGLELLICPVLRCLSNLLAEEMEGCNMQVQDERLLVALFTFMQYFLNHHLFIVQECLWLLNNLTADEPFFCSAMLTLDLIPALLQLLPCSRMVALLVLTVLCNIAEKGCAYCQQLHQKAVLSSLISILTLSDAEVAGQCLELLHLLFLHWPEAAADFFTQAGLQALEQHQHHPELQERVRALMNLATQPTAASPCSLVSSAAVPSSLP